jgi:hypothetical protein
MVLLFVIRTTRSNRTKAIGHHNYISQTKRITYIIKHLHKSVKHFKVLQAISHSASYKEFVYITN